MTLPPNPETEVRTILHELIEKVVSLHSENRAFDAKGKYIFTIPPPKQNFRFTH